MVGAVKRFLFPQSTTQGYALHKVEDSAVQLLSFVTSASWFVNELSVILSCSALLSTSDLDAKVLLFPATMLMIIPIYFEFYVRLILHLVWLSLLGGLTAATTSSPFLLALLVHISSHSIQRNTFQAQHSVSTFLCQHDPLPPCLPEIPQHLYICTRRNFTH
jgi:hypothetical protein